MFALEEVLWGQLILVLLLSFLTGLEFRDYRTQYHPDEKLFVFGSIRTFAFSGLLGFVFYLLDPNFFLVGLLLIGALFLLLYWYNLQAQQPSILAFLIWCLTYSYGPLIMTQALWVVASVFVVTVLLLGYKNQINRLAEKLDVTEMLTLAKLVLLSVVILPLLPQTPIADWLPVSPFKVWLAVVIVSSVSYLGYMAQRYLFPNQGLLVTSIFGGLYSSTATTIVLAKKSSEFPRMSYQTTAAILLATGLMYLRLWGIAALFNWQVAKLLIWPIISFVILTSVIVVWFLWREKRRNDPAEGRSNAHANPLELKVAFVFAGLFVLMALITQVVTTEFGSEGLRYLSLIVGFTDIDPFVLSLLNGIYPTSDVMIASAILIAAGSNNLLKAVYAWSLSCPQVGRASSLVLVGLGLATIGLGWAWSV